MIHLASACMHYLKPSTYTNKHYNIIIGHSYAKIVSFPRQLYVLEGDNDTVGCQNRSMDEQIFYSYVSNAIWWRHDTDGTIIRITTFGSVYSFGHKLYFNPFSSENQGIYYCCLPDESACSNISIVRRSSKLIFIAIQYIHLRNNSSYVCSSTQCQSIQLKLHCSSWITIGIGMQYY